MGDWDVENWLDARRPEAAVRGKLAPGAKLGEWRICAFLGAGLSAEVYRVTSVRFAKEGALKLLVDDTRGLKDRFLTEADAIRFLSLRALPRFMGSGEYNGMPYYVMEYLQPLPDPMRRREIPRFANALAKAVQTLHEAGYIHRDLKPGNVLRRQNGEPVLIDLGLVKKRGAGVRDPIVRHGRRLSMIDGKPVGVGTLDFAAPEQLLRGEASVQSDVFALGKILRSFYEGHPPRAIRRIIRRATHEEPSDRYPSANAFAAAIRHRHRADWLRGLFAAALVAAAVLGIRFLRVPRSDAIGPARAAQPIQVVTRPSPGTNAVSVARLEDETDSAYLARITPAAAAGHLNAQLLVAEAHFYGHGTPTNRAEAVKWYRLAAQAGAASAQASLGLCALRGWGCERDPGEAVHWYSLAAAQGNLAAMSDLAYCFLNGVGVERNEEIGFKWALKAAEAGFAPAQTMVGECYVFGRGVAADGARGEDWLSRAAAQGNRRAQSLLDAR